MVLYDTPDELTEERERIRYDGRTRREIIEDVLCMEEVIFSLGGSGDISEAYNTIFNDPGMLTLFDEIARGKDERRERESGEITYFVGDSTYHTIERVKRMLHEERRMPQELFEI